MILTEDDVVQFRQIYLDGRGHPPDPNPTWTGHAIGKWEGDTLVVDVAGFNDTSWLEPFPHTEKLHVVQRYRAIAELERWRKGGLHESFFNQLFGT